MGPQVLGTQLREAVVAYAWTSPSVVPSLEAQVARIRRHALEQGWEVVAELQVRRYPELIELCRRAESGVRRIAMTREALADVERRFPEIWLEVRARLASRGVVLTVL
jgi:hypothetical protein